MSSHFDEDLVCPQCGGDGLAADNGTNCGVCEICDGTGMLEDYGDDDAE